MRSEYITGMWVRNGGAIRSAIGMYDRSAFSFGFQIPDLFLIRFDNF